MIQSPNQSTPVKKVPVMDIVSNTEPERGISRNSIKDSLTFKRRFGTSSLKNGYVSDMVNARSILDIRQVQMTAALTENPSSGRRVKINVSGDIYETYRTTLDVFPDTLLGNSKERKYYYDKNRQEYYFDRHRTCFSAILYYYQSQGRLRRPESVPLDIFLEEILFFQLGQDALTQLRKDENIKVIKKLHLPTNRIRRFIWATTEYVNYSKISMIYHIISILLILLSVVSLAVETLPQYSDIYDIACPSASNTTNSTFTNSSVNVSSTQEPSVCLDYYSSSFFFIDTICAGCFTIDFLIRLWSTPSLIKFIKTLMNWIDLIAIVPFYVTLGIYLSNEMSQVNTNVLDFLRFLRTVRLIQVFKFGRILRNVKSLRVYVVTIKESLIDFITILVMVVAVGFIFGASVYYSEQASNNRTFDSVFTGTYWGIISILAVGYGDLIATTPMGQVISCVCALVGTATTGLMISILVNRYQNAYVRTVFIDQAVIDFCNRSNISHHDVDQKKSVKSRESKIDADNDWLELTERPNLQVREENANTQNNDQYPLIIGYVDNDRQEISSQLIKRIKSIIDNKKTLGCDIELNIYAEDEESPSLAVQFHLQSSSDDEFSCNDDDDDENLTEIIHGDKTKGAVLKTFHRRSSDTPYP